MKARIAVLAGDGIGPEVVAEGVRVPARGRRAVRPRVRADAKRRSAASPSTLHGDPLPAGHARRLPGGRCGAARRHRRPEVVGARREAAARTGPAAPAPRARRVRQPAAGASCTRACVDASTLKPEVLDGVDLVFVRELTGGIYFGEKTPRRRRSASDLCTLHRRRGRAHHARRRRASHARGASKLTSIDKANVLETSRLWREVAERVMQRGIPGRRARAHAGRCGRDAPASAARATSTCCSPRTCSATS